MFLFATEIWLPIFFFAKFAKSDGELNPEQKESFYRSAKTFLLCNICLEIQSGNITTARVFLRQLIELNNQLGHAEFDGLPTPAGIQTAAGIQTTTADPPPTEKSRVSNLFNHRENVLRRLAQPSESVQKSGTVTYAFEFDGQFCGSLNCNEFELSVNNNRK